MYIYLAREFGWLGGWVDSSGRKLNVDLGFIICIGTSTIL